MLNDFWPIIIIFKSKRLWLFDQLLSSSNQKDVTFRIYTATFDKALMRTMQPVLGAVGAYIFDGVQFFSNQEIDPGFLEI